MKYIFAQLYIIRVIMSIIHDYLVARAVTVQPSKRCIRAPYFGITTEKEVFSAFEVTFTVPPAS